MYGRTGIRKKDEQSTPHLLRACESASCVLFALLLVVSLLGVGRLFQIRVDYENNIARYFQLELQSERLRSAFILEQAARPPRAAGPAAQPGRAERAPPPASRLPPPQARPLTGGRHSLTSRLDRLIASEAAWRKSVAKAAPPADGAAAAVERRLTSAVTDGGETLGGRDPAAPETPRRDDARTIPATRPPRRRRVCSGHCSPRCSSSPA